MPKRIYLANTGGTIGMAPSSSGYRPASGFLAEQLETLSELRRPAMPRFALQEFSPLLDSANMTPADWVRIAHDIAAHYDEYDAFVVLHGTDTMAYTASALSFMLKNLGKTVILTGSQLPLCEIRSDARENLITSLLIAAQEPIPEVCLFFDQKLLRGNRARKVHAASLDAFDSPNYPPLGVTGIDIRIARERLLVPDGRPLEVREITQPFVGQVRLFPGISASIVENFLRPPLQGLVLETYGVGNAPARDERLIEAIGEASERGVVIVACTQCLSGSVELGDYATGDALRRAGVISGFDMTPEAALTKLFYLFSLDLQPPEVRRRMQLNLRGELTPPPGAD